MENTIAEGRYKMTFDYGLADFIALETINPN
jgi:hypothetical protein